MFAVPVFVAMVPRDVFPVSCLADVARAAKLPAIVVRVARPRLNKATSENVPLSDDAVVSLGLPIAVSSKARSAFAEVIKAFVVVRSTEPPPPPPVVNSAPVVLSTSNGIAPPVESTTGKVSPEVHRIATGRTWGFLTGGVAIYLFLNCDESVCRSCSDYADCIVRDVVA